jgi:6-pyruvoyltetrahydropterin/6-carboxytetrahydropterin synthase
MSYEISQRFFFDAAHTLARRIEAEGSARVHGHTYQGEVALAGEPDPATGMVWDLGHLRAELQKVRALLDHHMLDEIAGLGAPTLENLCRFVAQQVQAAGFPVSRVAIWREGIGDRCELRFE